MDYQNVNALELGRLLSGDRPVYLDMHASGAPGTLDYSARIIREGGANGEMHFRQTGTGAYKFLDNVGNEKLRIPAVAGQFVYSFENFEVHKAQASFLANALSGDPIFGLMRGGAFRAGIGHSGGHVYVNIHDVNGAYQDTALLISQSLGGAVTVNSRQLELSSGYGVSWPGQALIYRDGNTNLYYDNYAAAHVFRGAGYADKFIIFQTQVVSRLPLKVEGAGFYPASLELKNTNTGADMRIGQKDDGKLSLTSETDARELLNAFRSGLVEVPGSLDVKETYGSVGTRFANAPKFNNSRNLTGGTHDCNADIEDGDYDAANFLNGPYPDFGWGYFQQRSHSYNRTDWRFQKITSFYRGEPVTWGRFKRGGGWSSWHPISGFATPAHFGGDGSLRPDSIPSVSTLAIERWLNYPGPKYLDRWYAMNYGIGVNIAGMNGYKLAGNGSQGGIRIDAVCGIDIYGADQDNPAGMNADLYTMLDICIMLNFYGSAIPLQLRAAGGDSGSQQPGIAARNLLFLQSSPDAGSTATALLLENIRQGHLMNVSGGGKRFGYEGFGITYRSTQDSAPVQVKHYDCRWVHVGKGFVTEPSSGGAAYDDTQGYYWKDCEVVACNRGWDIYGGPEGFGEQYVLDNCHSYFREVGAYFENCSKIVIPMAYFLGHGTAPGGVCQALAVSGSSPAHGSNIDIGRIYADLAPSSSGQRHDVNIPSPYIGDIRRLYTRGTTSGGGALVNGAVTKTVVNF